MRALRVLHVPDSVGGHGPGLARAERALGVESVSVALRSSPFGYDVEEIIGPPGTSRLRYERRRLSLLLRALREFDVVHFNFGRTLIPERLGAFDLPLLRRAGKAVFVTFQGDDARRGDAARARGGLSLPTALPELYPAGEDATRRRRVARFERYAHGIFYLNPDLAHVLPDRAEFVAYAHVDPRAVSVVERAPTESLLVVHAPSDRVVKGTPLIVAAIERLQAERVAIELELVQGRSHRDARDVFARADLGVDQLYAGWYGGVAVEVMALGKPVIAYLRTDDLGVLPSAMREALPLLVATPDDVQDVLRHWATATRADLERVGRASRAYIEQWHDPLRIAEWTIERYRTAVERR